MGRTKGSKNIQMISKELAEYPLSVKQFDLLHALLESDGVIKDACKAVGISRQTYYNWTRDDVFQVGLEKTKVELERRRDLLDEERVKVVEDALFDKATNGKDTNAMIFHLKNRAPKRWKNDYIQGQEYTQYIQNNINFIKTEIGDMSNRELLEEAKKSFEKVFFVLHFIRKSSIVLYLNKFGL